MCFSRNCVLKVGEQNVFLFGNLSEDVEDLRHSHFYGEHKLNSELLKVFDAIRQGMFGDEGAFNGLVGSIADHGDYYLVSDDFDSYCKTQDLIDATYKNQEEWITKCITSVARMGFFTSDRCINEYADTIWNIEPLAVKEEAEVRARTGLEN